MEITPEQAEALRIAGELIDGGVPVFAAPPCPGADCPRDGHGNGKVEYDLPAKWQLTVPSRGWLEKWRPGWALAAVGGHVADFLDNDPRYGGNESIAALEAAGEMPRVFGVQATPSGGYHYVISPLHERETNGFMDGLDYQGGLPDGRSRAFIWIAPTVRASKVEPFAPVEYRWAQEPDLAYLSEFDQGDDSIEGLRGRILARKVKAPGNERAGGDLERREFTEDEARRFCSITLERLEQAPIGQIEECANAAAVQLSHFVPEMWSVDYAFAVLGYSLSQTAYDPAGPSAWTAEKFRDVIAGVNGRAPADWEAMPKPASVDEVVPELTAVQKLLAEMLGPGEVIAKPPPRPLIRGLLNLDSESWIIGEPGSKKSFVAVDMAAHVALGRLWQGRQVHQGGVVMIVAEGAGGLGPRLRAWELEHGQRLPDSIRILPRPVQAARLDDWAVLREACRELGPALVVLDTQARVTVGLEENSAKEMGVFIEAVRSIREATGACVLTVHHTGRKGGDARGSSAIDGAQHTELKVDVAAGSLRGKLVTEKQKDMEKAPDVDLVFAVHVTGQDEDGLDVTSLALVSDAYKKLGGTGDEARPDGWEQEHISVVEMVVRALTDHGLDRGVTKAEARGIVVERFFGRDPARLKKATWMTAWNRALQRDGVIQVGGERFTFDPMNGSADTGVAPS